MNFFDLREANYKEIETILREINIVDKCGLKPFTYEQIGSDSSYGVVFKINTGKYNLIVKLTSVSENTEYYDLFKEDVLENRNPHFALTWENISCQKKCYFIDPYTISTYLDIDEMKENCFLLFAELFQGDLSNLLEKMQNKKDQKKIFCSVLCQVIVGLNQLEQEGVAHEDLHTGNVLYSYIDDRKEVDLTDEKYLKYVFYIRDKELVFYIKHCNVVCVLWDLDFVSEIGTPSRRTNEKEEKMDQTKTVQIKKSPSFFESVLNFFGNKEDGIKNIVVSPYWDLAILSKSFPSLYNVFKEKAFEFSKKDVNERNEYLRNNYMMVDMLIELSQRKEFEDILLFNANIDESLVTKTFYPNR